MISGRKQGYHTALAPRRDEKVFEPFEQGSKGKMNKGVGLGLSLVRDIVKLHGGEVSLESAVGKGTTVTLLIPNEVKENALEEYIKEKIA